MDTAEQALRRVADMFADLGGTGAADPRQVYRGLTEVALRRVGGTGAATVTTYDGRSFHTATATHEAARRADALQYTLGSGPCLTAVLDAPACHLQDLGHDLRWPDFGRRVIAECGYVGVLSVRLAESAETEPTRTTAGLNLYADGANAFDVEAVQMALLLASYAGIVVTAANNSARAANLERALRTNKDIGTAIGMLMVRNEITHDQAMSLLRTTSQRANRKVSDLVAQMITTGVVPGSGARRPPSSQRGG